ILLYILLFLILLFSSFQHLLKFLVLLNIDFFDAALTVIEPLGTKHVINDIVTATAIAFFYYYFPFQNSSSFFTLKDILI
ncbi:hypothetical protein, partial [Eubacterium ventriosum]|uniref:hypothetical protein n=1 Tax=Eubacterium ventriosum TaxID=39496 RepID=UPI001A9A46F2